MSAVYDYGQKQKEEGKKEAIKKMAKYMIREQKTTEEIMKETGLSLEEIQNLRESI